MFTSDMIVYIENPNESLKNIIELLNKVSKVGEYKINTQKSYFCILINEHKKVKSKNIIPLQSLQKLLRYTLIKHL